MKDENHLSPREIVSHINKTSSILPKGIQAELLGISRSSLYYQPQSVDPEKLLIMNQIDELYTRRPFYGSRRIARDLGYNRKRIQKVNAGNSLVRFNRGFQYVLSFERRLYLEIYHDTEEIGLYN